MAPLYGSRIPSDFRIEFVRHLSAKKIVLSYFRYEHPRSSDDSLMAMSTGWHVFLGKRWVKPAKVAELVEHIKELGVWGYCNSRSRRVKEIHYWVGKHARRINVMEFLLHEMAHAGGFRTERLACKVAGLGSFAYGVFESKFASLINEQRTDKPPRKREMANKGMRDQVRRHY